MKKFRSIFQKTLGTAIIIFIFVTCVTSGQQVRGLSEKEIFSIGFPRTIFFRGDQAGINEGYSFWEELHLPYNGVTKKFLTEEADLGPLGAEYANKFVEKHPEKLMFVHLNGEQIAIKNKEVHQLYFPGHWIYEVGTYLTGDIDANTNVLTVESAEAFSEEAYVIRPNIDTYPHDILLIEIDDAGNRLWNKFEYVTLEKVDYDNNTIIVKRGQYFSKPREFKNGITYVAPIAGNGWANNLLWYLNLSSVCPKDKNGQTAADVFLDQIKSWFSRNGELRNFDGIGFDVNYFMATHHTRWDTNNDGEADRGVVDGVNIWRKGNWAFLNRLRDTFGDEFIITADGWRDEMQRAVGVLNGMESEGLCRPNDGYRQISRTINQQTYWGMHNNAKYSLNYITSKLMNPVDLAISTQLRRMGLGVAVCLGAAYTNYYMPEIDGGALNQPHWLGQATSDVVFPAKDTPDLFEGLGVTMNNDLLSRFDLMDVNYRVENDILYIKGTDTKPYTDISIPGPAIDLPQDGDLIIFLEAKALTGFHDLESDNRVPRKINIKVNSKPSYTLPGESETPQYIAMHNELAGFMGTPGYTPMSFYFRKVGNKDQPVRISIEVEEQGEFAIRNLTAHNAASTMVREFEYGVVLVNPSYDDHIFDLENLIPGNSSYRRIQAKRTDSSNHQQDVLEDILHYNNGSQISDPSDVLVPGLNALFLIKGNR